MTIDQVLASGVAPRPQVARAIYRIVVRDLLLMCRIGIYEHERLAPQRVRINVDLAVTETAGAAADDIVNVYNYEDVINGVKAVIASGHINLVETLAEEIAAHCLKTSIVEDVRVRVEKLDVYADCESIGIEIERKQSKSRMAERRQIGVSGSYPLPKAIVKLGGSLASGPWLRPWLAELARHPVVVVPGGGPFADIVRQTQETLKFGDGAAHRMALTAMDQFGRALADMEPKFQLASQPMDIGRALAGGRPVIWLPSGLIEGHRDIQEGWDVTSDSLSAWLAGALGVTRLILVKSTLPSGTVTSVAEMMATGLVDPAFGKFLPKTVSAHLLRCDQVADIGSMLDGAAMGPDGASVGTAVTP